MSRRQAVRGAATASTLAAVALAAGGSAAAPATAAPATSPAVPPTVTRVVGHGVSSTGGSFEVDGTGFGPGTTVRVGTRAARSVRVLSRNRLWVDVDALPAGTAPVRVSSHGATSGAGTRSALVVHPASGVRDHTGGRARPTGVRAAAASAIDAHLLSCLDDALGLPQHSTVTPDQLATLTSLACANRGITSIAGLEAATSLRQVDLSDNQIRDASPLAALTGLTEAWLSGNRLGNVSALAGKPSLAIVDISDNPVTSLAPLAGATALTDLLADNTAVSDLTPLAGLPALSSLHVQFAHVTSLAPLASSPSLSDLQLWGNHVTSLAPLAGVHTLTRLDVSHNAVVDLTPLAGLASLTQLGLEGTGVSRLEPLARLTGLTSLQLDANQVHDVSPLAGLRNLVWLFVRQNHVTDLASLRALRVNAIEAEGQTVVLGSHQQALVRDRRGSRVSVLGGGFATADGTFTGTVSRRGVERLGDADGDGRADLWTLTGSTLRLWHGTASSVSSPRRAPGDWSATNLLVRVADVDGNGLSDLLTRDGSGTLWLQPVLGPGQLGPQRVMGRRWNAMTAVLSGGRMTGSSAQFVLARRSDGALFRYQVTASGLRPGVLVGRGFNGMRLLVGAGDLDGDGRADVLAVRQDGTLWSYSSTPRGTLGAAHRLGQGWGSFSSVSVPGDLDGDGRADLAGLRPDGTVFVYHRGVRAWGAGHRVATGWQDVRLFA